MLRLTSGLINPSIPVSFQWRCLTCNWDAESLCRIVSGVGSLDAMEASLDGFDVSPLIAYEVINSTSRAEACSRRILRFMSWAWRSSSELEGWDEVLNHTIRIMAKKRDLFAVDILISDLRKEQRRMETQTFCLVAETLVKAGREADAVGLFKNLGKFKCPIDATSLSAIVHALCSKGYARKAQLVIWHHRHKLRLPVEPYLYNAILHGWSIHGDVKEARTVLDEMKTLRIPPGTSSYNAFLRCLCNRNLKFNPSALVPEASLVITEMRSLGVPLSAVSFNILISCLCKIRRVKEAYKVLLAMRENCCFPDWMSYYLVARVLYLTGRFVKGNKLIDQMNEEGLTPGPSFYRGIIAVLCGVDRIDDALAMFDRMKILQSCPLNEKTHAFGRVYSLLITKLCRDGCFEKGKSLWKEAAESGITLQCSEDMLDPLNSQVYVPNKAQNRVLL